MKTARSLVKSALAVCIVGGIVFAEATVARADVLQAYNFSSTLLDGYLGSNSIAGQFTLDLTNSSIPSYEFTTPVPGDTFDSVDERVYCTVNAVYWSDACWEFP